MHHHGGSIPFFEKQRANGRATALDDMPVLTQDQQELWEMYCFTGTDILLSLDVYDRKIGLPVNWEFRDCVLLVSKMQNKRAELEKAKRDD